MGEKNNENRKQWSKFNSGTSRMQAVQSNTKWTFNAIHIINLVVFGVIIIKVISNNHVALDIYLNDQ